MEEEKKNKAREDEKAALAKEQAQFEEMVSKIIREAEQESKKRINDV